MTALQKQDMARANELMRTYAQSLENKKALEAGIANEMNAYKENMQKAEKELLEIGERNRNLFEDDNLRFDDGYLHVANNSVVETTKKFSMTDFLEQKGDLVKISFETAKIKKAWLDTDHHNELIALGVQVNTEKVLEVKVNKK